jgi:hypothetical protein
MQAVRLDVPVPGTGENGLSEQCVAITAAQGALRSFAYAITSARNDGDPQNPEGQITTPGRPSDANVNAAAVGIDCL